MGVIPAPASIVRRSKRLLDKNSEGNKLIRASASTCAEVRQIKKSLMNFASFKSFTGRAPPNPESPSLSLPTRRLNSTKTGFQSSTYSGHLLRPGPLSSLLSPLSAPSSPSAATSGQGMTGSAGSAIIRSSRQSWAELSPGGSLQAGLNHAARGNRCCPLRRSRCLVQFGLVPHPQW